MIYIMNLRVFRGARVGWGERGLGDIPMEGCLIKWIGVGVGL